MSTHDIITTIKCPEDIDVVVNKIIPAECTALCTASANETFWRNSSRDVLKGIIIYMRENDDFKGELTSKKICEFIETEGKYLWKKHLSKNKNITEYVHTVAVNEHNKGSVVPMSVLSTVVSFLKPFCSKN